MVAAGTAELGVGVRVAGVFGGGGPVVTEAVVKESDPTRGSRGTRGSCGGGSGGAAAAGASVGQRAARRGSALRRLLGAVVAEVDGKMVSETGCVANLDGSGVRSEPEAARQRGKGKR